MHHFGLKNKTYDLDLLKSYAAGDYKSILHVTEFFDSFEDWPWPLLYKEFDNKYPEAKFILSIRSSDETWFESLCHHAEKTGPTEARKIVYGYPMPKENPEYHKTFYNNFNQRVWDYFSDRPSKLLTVCWENGDGWQQLCSFLGFPVPDVAFPHINKGVR